MFVDELAPFTFMMDTNWSARELAARTRATPWVIQQSFVVPLDRSAASPGRPVEAFLEAVTRLVHDLHLTMSGLDLLFLPKDDIMLSAARGSESCVVSVLRQGVARDAVERVRTLFKKLPEVCALLGGRVSLTKCVYVDPDVFQHMYGTALSEFGELRRVVDPQDTLRSALYDRMLRQACRNG